MKHLMIAAAAALVFTGFGITAAGAEPYHHRHGGYRDGGPPGVYIGQGGVRVVPPRRHVRRDCWLEKRVKRDWEGHRRVYNVRVCR
ncbi:hypothetical protein ABID16_001952 [Rhizobium aquaticum]|uniref:Uncharacterized protein n=1 Tax=Rhizobium aquaticum TaxID=1549636 RepID=A0ABV2IZ27_9HYPH